MKTKNGFPFGSLLLIGVFYAFPVFADSGGGYTIIRRYPVAGSSEVSCMTGIGITSSRSFDSYKVSAAEYHVIGSLSGSHKGSVSLSVDGLTDVFQPDTKFALGETVQVFFSGTLSGGYIARDTFEFRIVKRFLIPSPESPSGTLGSLLPDVLVSVDKNPTPGQIFLASYGVPEEGNLMILNQDGILQKSLPASAMNFEQHSNGEWTYFDGIKNAFMALDTNFQTIREYRFSDTTITTDLHELILSSDGSYTMMGLIKTTSDLFKQGVVGGDSEATILSNVVERFDAAGRLVFQWRGIDHYDVLDAIHENLASTVIDFEHANSIDIDGSGNYLLSNRNLSELTKIDGTTGQIIWRFGGVHNQFTFQNDSLGFSYQHDARWQPHGRITMLDNGNFHDRGKVIPPPESRAVEYYLDTSSMQAYVVWQYRHSPPVWAQAMGSVQQLPNENFFIGWGQNMVLGGPPGMTTAAATEVTFDDSLVFEMGFKSPPTIYSYRAHKYPTQASFAVRTDQSGSFHAEVTATQDGYAISFDTPQPEMISVTLRDVLGRTIKHVFDGLSSGSSQRLQLPLTGLSSGVVFCTVNSSQGSAVLPIVITH